MNDIQEVILDIFKKVSNICEQHNIPYYAIGGTCIGAARHNGFIPWDDDLDVAIPIQDYDRFWEIAKKELPDNYKTYLCKDVRTYRYIFGKVHNIETTFIEKSEIGKNEAYKGIFVDIMPISSIPSDDENKEKFYKKTILYHKMNFIRRFPYKDMKSIKEKVMWLLMRPICVFSKYDFFSERWLNMLRKYPLGSTELTGYTWSPQVRRLTFPMKDFENTVDLRFEDTMIKCPAGYNNYLTIQFGDYMKLPPENQRAPHHTEVIDIKKSYINYTEGEPK